VIRHASSRDRDDGKATRHGLEYDQSERLGQRCEDERVAAGVEHGQLGPPVEVPEEDGARRRRGPQCWFLRTSTGDDESRRIRRKHALGDGIRLHDVLDTLLGREPADVHEGEAVADAVLFPPRRRAVARMVCRDVDAAAPDLDIAGAGAEEVRSGRMRRRVRAPAAPVKPRDVLRDGVSHPRHAVRRGVAREVRVVG
jgi:hypothetical protein